MNRKAILGLLAVLALTLGLSATAASAAAGGPDTATASKTKKKSKGKKKSCKRGKGKKGGKGKSTKSATASKRKSGKSKNCGKGKSGSKGGSAGKLANGRYEDARNGLIFKVTGNGGRIQLYQIDFPSLCIPIRVGSDTAVPLKSGRGPASAEQSFTVSGGSVITVNWAVEIEPESRRYTLNYSIDYEIPSADPEVQPVRCGDRGRYSGTLAH